MKNNLVLILKGLIIGFAKIIPGVSGAMLAISLNVYEKSIEIISDFFKDIANNIKFLGLLGLGILISIVLGSNIINYFFNNHYFPTMLLFVGLIIGGLTEIKNNKKCDTKNIIIFFITLVAVIMFEVVNGNQEELVFELNLSTFLILFLLGIVEAATMIIPGISGTAIMLILGCYHSLLSIWANILNSSLFLKNIILLIPFFIGVLFGTVILAKIMNYLFKKKKDLTYSGILGFSVGSIIILFSQTFKYNYQLSELIIGVILLITGYKSAKYIDKIK